MGFYNEYLSIGDNIAFIADGNIKTKYWIDDDTIYGQCSDGMGYVYQLSHQQLAKLLENRDDISVIVNTNIYVPISEYRNNQEDES